MYGKSSYNGTPEEAAYRSCQVLLEAITGQLTLTAQNGL
jgi:hypothetical protein